MKIPIQMDVYKIINQLDVDQLRDLCYNLVDSWLHAKDCKSIKVSAPFGENNEMVLVGASGEPCSCGSDERLGKCFNSAVLDR